VEVRRPQAAHPCTAFRRYGPLVRRAYKSGRTRTFVAALALAAVVLPVATALAYFSATGGGTISNVQAGSPSSVIALTTTGPFTYSGPSTVNLQPGGTVGFTVQAACTAGCPAVLTTINLASWTSDKAGCDTATLPGSFTMPQVLYNGNVANATPINVGTAVITWVNLGVSQNACAGAKFAFALVTP
jgi:hypothetical protein